MGGADRNGGSDGVGGWFWQWVVLVLALAVGGAGGDRW